MADSNHVLLKTKRKNNQRSGPVKNKNMNNFVIGLLTVIGFLAITALILGLPLMLLWNWLMPNLFGLIEITFWQAVGLNLLSSILFKTYTSKK
jgi:hypothetical protein